MPLTFESRLPEVGTSIFAVMSRLATEHEAINLSQGFPNFPIDADLVDLVSEASKAGFNQYAPMPGWPGLRTAIAEKVAHDYGRQLNPETEITITAGATQAIYTAISALIHPGEEVIVFDPAYDSYDPSIRMAGGKPVHIPLTFPGFQIDWDHVKSSITTSTRMIVVNSPHNPCGSVLSLADIRELEALAQQHDLIVLSDEVYEHLIFDNLQHHTLLASAALADRCLVVNSFGKTFHATGWKIGYISGPAYLMAEIRKVHQFLVFSVNTPIQVALAEYVRNPANYSDLPAFYQSKRDFFRNQLKDSSFELLPCSGSYFQLVSYEHFTRLADKEVAYRLTTGAGVAAIPVSAFYADQTDHHLLRFCFAKDDATLTAAGKILRNVTEL